ncbi:MAG: CDGSH iron-sulfur domain-containing protein [Acidimicrobiales bacterium]
MEEPANPTRSVDGPSVRASANGPLVVTGDVPLYRRRAVHSEHGEPLAWETTERVETATRYALCRCGASERKPFCDGTHGRVGFEAADDAAGTYDTRAKVLGGSGITVRDDRSICVHAGFWGPHRQRVGPGGSHGGIDGARPDHLDDRALPVGGAHLPLRRPRRRHRGPAPAPSR